MQKMSLFRTSASVISELNAPFAVTKPIFSAEVDVAVFTPMTSPAALTRGPPELPELIAASVCIISTRSSDEEALLSVAVIERPIPDMIPDVTVFWNWPRALPIIISFS